MSSLGISTVSLGDKALFLCGFTILKGAVDLRIKAHACCMLATLTQGILD
jgi:hypothetical protein